MDINSLFHRATEHSRVIRLPELCALMGLSPSTVYNRLNPNSPWRDPSFPAPIRLGAGRRCAKGWLLDDVLAYLRRQRQAG